MKKIAIIGSGISGLSTAYHLHQDYDITIFEKEGYLGGHTDTHSLTIDDQTVRVDSGFIIYCPQFYPHFNAMLTDLGVTCEATDMSFSAHNRQTGVIYNATSLNKLFCQRKNLFSLKFYRMLLDIVRFYSLSVRVLKTDDNRTSVKQYLDSHRYSRQFKDDHLLPMISALWSKTPEQVEQFPIRHLIEFFECHGLLKINNRPQWMVVSNGSASYVDALRERLSCNFLKNSPVDRVQRTDQQVLLTSNQQTHTFDAVVFATHSDQALKIIDQPSIDEQRILSAIPFVNNHVVVHTDESIMHPNKQSWASWNTEVPSHFDAVTLGCCTANYWMNSLQNLPINSNVFTSLNSHHKIAPEKKLSERYYSHPVFNANSVAAQREKHLIDGQNRSYFVGAYWGWGFHEDGARSAFKVSQQIREQLQSTSHQALPSSPAANPA